MATQATPPPQNGGSPPWGPRKMTRQDPPTSAMTRHLSRDRGRGKKGVTRNFSICSLIKDYFDPSIRQHSGIWGVAEEAMLNIVRKKIKKIPQKNILQPVYLNKIIMCGAPPPPPPTQKRHMHRTLGRQGAPGSVYRNNWSQIWCIKMGISEGRLGQL